MVQCAGCKQTDLKNIFQCSGCFITFYCGKECQKNDFPNHDCSKICFIKGQNKKRGREEGGRNCKEDPLSGDDIYQLDHYEMERMDENTDAVHIWCYNWDSFFAYIVSFIPEYQARWEDSYTLITDTFEDRRSHNELRSIPQNIFTRETMTKKELDKFFIGFYAFKLNQLLQDSFPVSKLMDTLTYIAHVAIWQNHKRDILKRMREKSTQLPSIVDMLSNPKVDPVTVIETLFDTNSVTLDVLFKSVETFLDFRQVGVEKVLDINAARLIANSHHIKLDNVQYFSLVAHFFRPYISKRYGDSLETLYAAKKTLRYDSSGMFESKVMPKLLDEYLKRNDNPERKLVRFALQTDNGMDVEHDPVARVAVTKVLENDNLRILLTLNSGNYAGMCKQYILQTKMLEREVTEKNWEFIFGTAAITHLAKDYDFHMLILRYARAVMDRFYGGDFWKFAFAMSKDIENDEVVSILVVIPQDTFGIRGKITNATDLVRELETIPFELYNGSSHLPMEIIKYMCNAPSFKIPNPQDRTFAQRFTDALIHFYGEVSDEEFSDYYEYMLIPLLHLLDSPAEYFLKFFKIDSPPQSIYTRVLHMYLLLESPNVVLTNKVIRYIVETSREAEDIDCFSVFSYDQEKTIAARISENIDLSDLSWNDFEKFFGFGVYMMEWLLHEHFDEFKERAKVNGRLLYRMIAERLTNSYERDDLLQIVLNTNDGAVILNIIEAVSNYGRWEYKLLPGLLMRLSDKLRELQSISREKI